MSDKPETPTTEKPKQMQRMANFKIIVELQDGRIQVTGPIENKTLCVRMLCGAVESIYEYHMEKVLKTKSGGITIPPNLLMPNLGVQ